MSKRIHNLGVVFTSAMLIVVSVLATLPMLTQKVSAAGTSETEILKKALLSGLRTCYSDTYMKKSIEGVDYSGAYSLMTSKGRSDGTVRVPNMIGNTLNDADVSCEQLFNGYNQNKTNNSIKGLISLFGKTPKLTDIGYSLGSSDYSSGASQNCIWFEYNYNDNGVRATGRTQQACFQVIDGKVQTLYDYTVVINDKAEGNYAGMTGGKVQLSYPFGGSSLELYVGDGNSNATKFINNDSDWSTVETDLKNWGEQAIDNAQKYNPVDYTSTPLYSGASLKSESGSGEIYETYARDTDGATKALRFFTGNSSASFTSDSVTFNSLDVYTLYTSYFNQSAKAHPDVLYRAADAQCTTENSYTYALYNNGKWCEVYGVENITDTYNGVDISGDYWTWKNNGPVSFSDIVKTLGKLNYDLIEAEGGTVGGLDGITIDNGNTGNNGDGNGTNSGSDDSSSIDKCYTAAASLGWIMCPVIQGASKVVTGIYDYMIKPFLAVKSSLLNPNGGNNSTYDGWKSFRDFANILFAIAFAVVIFAQITGVGISNYNVKKILPRLIMVAVLVNVSFILCQLAVDISNILGSSLQTTFSDMASKVNNPSGNPYDLGGIVSSAAATLFTVAGVGAAGLAIAVSWEIWLIPFLLALFGCLIGVIFFFVVLGIRQAGVILMVVLSPLAIVCYALPNTKSLFDKWWKIFSSLLMVYPICGALLGAGQFASALLVAAGSGEEGFFYMLVAMLLSVVPFFFIPSILKGSMAAMGNLGLRVSQFGQNFSRRVNSGIRNSELGRDTQRRLDMHNAARTYDRLTRKEEKHGGKLNDYDLRRRSRAAMRYNRAAFEDIRAGGGQELLREGSPNYDAAIAGQRRTQLNDDISGRETLFSNGSMKSIIPENAGAEINGEDDAALQGELDAYLGKIIRKEGTASEIEEYNRNAQAIANVLSGRGTGSARARVVDSLSRAMHENSATLMGASDEEKKRLTRDFGSIGSRLNAKFGKDYKKDFPGATALMSDIAKGDFSRADKFKTFKETDADGQEREHIRSTYYSGAGISGLSAEDFSRLKTSGLRNIWQGVQDGDVSGSQLESLGSLASTVLDSNVLTPDSDAIPYMQQIRNAAFANRAQSTTVQGRTAGSLAIGGAGSRSIDSIFQQIQSAPTWQSMSDAGDTKQMDAYRDLVSNISEAYQNDRFYQDDALRLHDALRIAHDKGILDSTGKVVAVPKAPAAFNVRQESKQQQQQAQQSSPLIVTPGQLTDAERQVVRERATQINRHARRNGQNGGGNIAGV